MLKNTRNLPSLPQVLLKLINACNNETCTPRQLAKIIFKDPSLSTQVLQLVNAAHGGQSEEITTLDKVITCLKPDTIKNIANNAAVRHVFRSPQERDGFNLHRFWWHSMMCASLSKAIAQETGYRSPEEAFLSGLLHDIGKLLLWVNFRKEYTALLHEAKDDPGQFIIGEMKLGAAHNEVGARLIRQWEMSSFMADAIHYHHDHPGRIKEALPLIKIVYVANVLSYGPERAARENNQAEVRSILKLDASRLEILAGNAMDETLKVARSFGIPAEPYAEQATWDSPANDALLWEVKIFSLLYGTVQSLLRTSNREEILRTIAQAYRVLINSKQVFFFLYEAEKDALIGQSTPGDMSSRLIEELVIPLNTGKSIFTRSLLEGTRVEPVVSRKKETLSITDEQILRQLGTDGMICLPLQIQGNPLGLIVMGFHEHQAASITKQKKMLSLIAGHAAMSLHIDNLKRTQTKIIQDERVKAVASISRKVVHEVNNPLGIIMNYLKIIGLKLPEKHPAQAGLNIIGEEIIRMGQIIQQLNDYSSSKIKEMALLDVNRLLTDILELMHEHLFRLAGIEARLTPDPRAPLILSEKDGLKQVFINLINNAVEAMPEGGHIGIATKYIPATGTKLSKAGEKKGGSLEITVKDDGPGIPEKIQEQLFEPIFDTKKEGCGLGLSIVHGIIRELDGTITCQSQTGVGTTFTLTLPVPTILINKVK